MVSKKDYSKTLDVYGSDITFSEYSQGATLPCFSMTKGKAMLTAIIEDGSLKVEILVTALDDGNIGQIISVKNQNNQTLKAQVVGKNQAIIK